MEVSEFNDMAEVLTKDISPGALAGPSRTTLLLLAKRRPTPPVNHPLLPLIQKGKPPLPPTLPRGTRNLRPRPITCQDVPQVQEIQNKVLASARRFGSAVECKVTPHTPVTRRVNWGPTSSDECLDARPASPHPHALVPHHPSKSLPGPMVPSPPTQSHPDTPRRQPLLRKPLIKLPEGDQACVKMIRNSKLKKLEPVSSGTIRYHVPAIMNTVDSSDNFEDKEALSRYPLRRKISNVAMPRAVLPSKKEKLLLKQLLPMQKEGGAISVHSEALSDRVLSPGPQQNTNPQYNDASSTRNKTPSGRIRALGFIRIKKQPEKQATHNTPESTSQTDDTESSDTATDGKHYPAMRPSDLVKRQSSHGDPSSVNRHSASSCRLLPVNLDPNRLNSGKLPTSNPKPRQRIPSGCVRATNLGGRPVTGGVRLENRARGLASSAHRGPIKPIQFDSHGAPSMTTEGEPPRSAVHQPRQPSAVAKLTTPAFRRPSTTNQPQPEPHESGKELSEVVQGQRLTLRHPWDAWVHPGLDVPELHQDQISASSDTTLDTLDSEQEDSGYENDKDIESIECKVPEPPKSSPVQPDRYKENMSKQLRVLNWLTDCTEDANGFYQEVQKF